MIIPQDRRAVIIMTIMLVAHILALHGNVANGNVVKAGIDDIIDAITDAISDFIDDISRSVTDFFDDVIDALSAPFNYLRSTFYDAYDWIEDNTGPLAPIVYIVIAGAAIIVAIFILKRILNAIAS